MSAEAVADVAATSRSRQELPERHLEAGICALRRGIGSAGRKANEVFCASSARFHSSAAVLAFIILLFCLLARPACRPDVPESTLTDHGTNSGERVERSARPDCCCRATRQGHKAV